MLNFFFKDYNEMRVRQAKAAWMVHTHTQTRQDIRERDSQVGQAKPQRT